MGYPTARRLLEIDQYCDCYLANVERPSILEFGDQVLRIKDDDISYIEEFLKKHDALGHLKKYKGRIGERVYVSEIYEDAGFTHRCLDLSGKNNALPVDLNLWPNPGLDETSFQAFDLVMNFGTTEHLANQINAFAVVHYLTRKNGLMLHSIPMLHCSAHAMVLVTPYLFKKLIDWNGYEIIDARWRSHLVNQAINFHYDAKLAFVKNFVKTVMESTRAATGIFLLRNTYADCFVPPLDVAVSGESERRLLEEYVQIYSHPLLNGNPRACVERVYTRPSITEQYLEASGVDPQYHGRHAYLLEEIDSDLTVSLQEGSSHHYRVFASDRNND